MREEILDTDSVRVGWVSDDDEDHSDMFGTLVNTGKQIELRVLAMSSDQAQEETFTAWFGTIHDDFPTESVDLTFFDEKGPIVLINCRVISLQHNPRVLKGTFVVDVLIDQAKSVNYREVNGMNSEIAGAVVWFGDRVTTTKHEELSGGTSSLVTFENVEPKQLNNTLKLTSLSTVKQQSTQHHRAHTIEEVVILSTKSDEPVSFETHYEQHEAIRQLISISAWRTTGFNTITVNRQDDPQRYIGNDKTTDTWRNIQSHGFHTNKPELFWTDFLIPFQEIRVDGVQEWMRVRKQFEDVFHPLYANLDYPEGYLVSAVTLSGIAIEALGYQLAKEQETLPKSRNQYYSEATQAIIDTLSFQPFDLDEWAKQSKESFMATKHTERTTPDTLDMYVATMDNFLIVRLWLAHRLGADLEQLEWRTQNFELRYRPDHK